MQGASETPPGAGPRNRSPDPFRLKKNPGICRDFLIDPIVKGRQVKVSVEYLAKY
jgi:hypothetical protein